MAHKLMNHFLCPKLKIIPIAECFAFDAVFLFPCLWAAEKSSLLSNGLHLLLEDRQWLLVFTFLMIAYFCSQYSAKTV